MLPGGTTASLSSLLSPDYLSHICFGNKGLGPKRNGRQGEEVVREAGALWGWGLLGGGKELPHDTADRAPWQEPEHLSLAPASALRSPMTQMKSLSASGPQFPHVTLEGFEDHLKAQKWALKPHSSLDSWGAYY